MFKITIEADSMEQLAARIAQLHAGTRVQFASEAEPAAPKPQTRSRKAPATEPEKIIPDAQPEPEAQDEELQRELNEPVEPMPETAKGVVDAGTGQPITPQAETKQMTFDDVKAAAAKLAAKSTPKLAELLKKHGGTNLSTLPKENLGAFAGDVLEALEA